MTTRSHDQYNTTIYGMDDRYRGVFGMGRVLFANRLDLEISVATGAGTPTSKSIPVLLSACA